MAGDFTFGFSETSWCNKSETTDIYLFMYVVKLYLGSNYSNNPIKLLLFQGENLLQLSLDLNTFVFEFIKTKHFKP